MYTHQGYVAGLVVRKADGLSDAGAGRNRYGRHREGGGRMTDRLTEARSSRRGADVESLEGHTQ